MISLSEHIKDCIAICTRCSQTCLGEAMTHCLEQGGDHVAPSHFRTMIACAEMCRASAAIMLTGADLHASVCRVCAEICEACARECEQLAGMEECVSVCRDCAESCRQMAQ